MCIPEKIIICKRMVHLLSYYSVRGTPTVYSLEHSITKLNEIPNPVQRYWAKETPSSLLCTGFDIAYNFVIERMLE